MSEDVLADPLRFVRGCKEDDRVIRIIRATAHASKRIRVGIYVLKPSVPPRAHRGIPTPSPVVGVLYSWFVGLLDVHLASEACDLLKCWRDQPGKCCPTCGSPDTRHVPDWEELALWRPMPEEWKDRAILTME